MQNETLERAKQIENRIKQLDKEIEHLFDFMPPTREYMKQHSNSKVGYVMQILRTKAKKFFLRKNDSYFLEITYDDIRAMQDLRRNELKELQKEMEEL